jgi:hypothetical protein
LGVGKYVSASKCGFFKKRGTDGGVKGEREGERERAGLREGRERGRKQR